MARRRFFVPSVRHGEASLTGDDAHHLTRVLRVEQGHIYEISDNEHAYLAEVRIARKSLVEFAVLEPLPPSPPQVQIHVLLALIKFDRFELALEKVTELGATRITPVKTERSEYGLEKAADKRFGRWQRILLEASQQSRRDRLPEIEKPISWSTALAVGASPRYFLDEERTAPPLLTQLPSPRTPADIVVLLIGPEGGWTPAEREEVAARSWQPVSIGSHILRAETAAIVGVALVANAWAATASA